jgi:hypothetical protein
MAKLGFIIPRTLSNALSFAREDSEPTPFHLQTGADDSEQNLRQRIGFSRSGGDSLPQRVVRIGRSIIPSAHGSRSSSRGPTPLSTVGTLAREDDDDVVRRKEVHDEAQRALEINRTIRFATDPSPSAGPS